jgi:glycerol-3-phosphate dehydrogenase
MLSASEYDPFDLLVVGGGITGAGIALDGVSRGLKVGLVERDDFASGTSSKSSKLVHGGLRYLEQREFGLVREASTERTLLSRLAPHMVEPFPFVIPISNRAIRAKFGVGLWAYDALASFKNMKVHRYIDRDETERLVPALPKGKLRGGFIFYDSKTDDARLVIEVLAQARRLGAAIANHAEVVHLSGDERLPAARVLDRLTGDTFDVSARRIIVAAGVWGDRVEELAKPDAEPRLRPSKGIHLSFRHEAIPMSTTAAFIPDAAHHRMLFVIPWIDAVIVGTTDDAYDGDIDAPNVTPADRTYVLDAVNNAFDLDLGDDDVAGAWAGLRPLISGKKGATADLSRRHKVYDIAPGIVGITGGKLTTYRRMAADAVDRIAPDLELEAKSRTRWIRLGCSDVPALTQAVMRRARRMGIPEDAARNLVRAYGDRALHVLDVAEAEDLAGPLIPGGLPIAAEAIYCARSEMATHLNDFLSRRTRLALTDPAAGAGGGSRARELMSAEFGWDEGESTRQLADHRGRIGYERGMPVHETAPEPTPEEPRVAG